ncbi:MAG: LysR family transcriptional regulator [Chloroflexia bacterium]|nr:LysR family transcriptional regulator [Chloroflexia bacterium]
MLDSYQLQLFLAVVEMGSYTAAARRLHLTQPAVSRQIRQLQQQLGVRLFRRVGRNMRPTHAGERLVETARLILALSQRAEEEMAGLRGEVMGVLRIGGSGTIAWQVLAQLLPAFRSEYPGVGFQLIPCPVVDVEGLLREGQLDMLISELDVVGRQLRSDLLLHMEALLAVPRDEHWGRRKRVPLGKLIDLDLILPAQRTAVRHFLEEKLANKEVFLPSSLRTMEVQDVAAAVPLVAAGLGVALLPHPLLRANSPEVHALILWPGFSWPMYFVHRANPRGRAEEVFGQFVREHGPELLEPIFGPKSS